MKGLIQKSGYIKPGNGGGHYAEYISTREDVEFMDAPYPSHEGSGYLEYMAQRPRSHGLFSADGPADLEQTMEEINAHAGPVWTFIYSLKREDAARLGYENDENWRRLLLAHQTELATAMKIPPSCFRWCGVFPRTHFGPWKDSGFQLAFLSPLTLKQPFYHLLILKAVVFHNFQLRFPLCQHSLDFRPQCVNVCVIPFSHDKTP